MKEIGATEFKQRCLAILDRIEPGGLVITKRGKPVAKLLPVPVQDAARIGALRGKIRIHGDLLSTGLKWDAQS